MTTTPTFYEVLEIENRAATAAEINKAYRKLALRYHPDRNANDPAATAKFQEINEAYQVLSDENKRAHYDAVFNQAVRQGRTDREAHAAACESMNIEQETKPAPAAQQSAPQQQSVPQQSVPQQSVPQQSVPRQSVPRQSAPRQSVPRQSAPRQSVPQQSVPQQSAPRQSAPQQSVPRQSAPRQSVPQQSAPQQSAPETDRSIPVGDTVSKKRSKPRYIEEDDLGIYLNFMPTQRSRSHYIEDDYSFTFIPLMGMTSISFFRPQPPVIVLFPDQNFILMLHLINMLEPVQLNIFCLGVTASQELNQYHRSVAAENRNRGPIIGENAGPNANRPVSRQPSVHQTPSVHNDPSVKRDASVKPGNVNKDRRRAHEEDQAILPHAPARRPGGR